MSKVWNKRIQMIIGSLFIVFLMILMDMLSR
ncbi:MAG: ATP-dependent RNA helicase [Mariprofundus sp.]